MAHQLRMSIRNYMVGMTLEMAREYRASLTDGACIGYADEFIGELEAENAVYSAAFNETFGPAMRAAARTVCQ